MAMCRDFIQNFSKLIVNELNGIQKLKRWYRKGCRISGTLARFVVLHHRAFAHIQQPNSFLKLSGLIMKESSFAMLHAFRVRTFVAISICCLANCALMNRMNSSELQLTVNIDSQSFESIVVPFAHVTIPVGVAHNAESRSLVISPASIVLAIIIKLSTFAAVSPAMAVSSNKFIQV